MPSAQLLFAGFSGLTGVIAGAYGSHGLKGKVSAERQQSFITGAHYQIVHSVAMMTALALQRVYGGYRNVNTYFKVAFAFFAAGVTMFSGSIYALVLGAPSQLGPVTPVGGVALMAGWASIMTAAALI